MVIFVQPAHFAKTAFITKVNSDLFLNMKNCWLEAFVAAVYPGGFSPGHGGSGVGGLSAQRGQGTPPGPHWLCFAMIYTVVPVSLLLCTLRWPVALEASVAGPRVCCRGHPGVQPSSQGREGLLRS